VVFYSVLAVVDVFLMLRAIKAGPPESQRVVGEARAYRAVAE
jgi:hypothetical protein